LQRKSGWTNWRHNPIKDQTKAPPKRRGNLGRRSAAFGTLNFDDSTAQSFALQRGYSF
jgi:hypothetical protein